MEDLEKQKRCCICGFDKVIDEHHVIPQRFYSRNKKKIFLCPNHHRMIHIKKYQKRILKQLLSKEIITKEEFDKITGLTEKVAYMRYYLIENFDITKNILTVELSKEKFIKKVEQLSDGVLDFYYRCVHQEMGYKAIKEIEEKWKT